MNKRFLIAVISFIAAFTLTSCTRSGENGSGSKETDRHDEITVNNIVGNDETGLEENTYEVFSYDDTETELNSYDDGYNDEVNENNDEQEDPYGYYNLLKANYEQSDYNDNIIKLDFNGIYKAFMYDDNTFVCIDRGRNTNDNSVMYVFSELSDEVVSKELDYNIGNVLFAKNGLIYIYSEDNQCNTSVFAIDLDGNIVYRCDFTDRFYIENIGGLISFDNNMANEEYQNYGILDDELNLISKGPFETKHGETVNIKPKEFRAFDGKIYAETWDGGTGRYTIWSYDYDSLSWKVENDMTDTDWSKLKYKHYGKYYVDESNIGGVHKLYDGETGEVILDKFSYKSGAGIYFGEDYHIAYGKGKWYKLKIASDYTIEWDDPSKCQELGAESTTEGVYLISERYYVIHDSYGVFLRTYEKGETEEVTIIKY